MPIEIKELVVRASMHNDVALGNSKRKKKDETFTPVKKIFLDQEFRDRVISIIEDHFSSYSH